MKKIFV